MRYLFPLLFIPSAAFAACAPGVNYGSIHILSPNPVCFTYSGSTLGGCYAFCGGVDGISGGSVCVEFPNAVPPTRGPYFSSGQECTPSDNNGPGSDPRPPVGEDGTATGDNGVVDVGNMWVGQNSHADIGKGFSVVSNNVRVGSAKVVGEIKNLTGKFETFAFDASQSLKESSQDLKRITNNTANLANAIGQGNEGINAQLMMLNQKQVLDSSFWNNKEERLIGTLGDIRKDLASLNNSGGGGGGNGGDGSDRIAQLLKVSQGIEANTAVMTGTSEIIKMLFGPQGPYFDTLTKMNGQLAGMGNSLAANNQLLSDISGKLDKLGEGGSGSGGGEGGDKPCKGPLCDFTKPPVSSGSGLSSVFSEESIADVKKQVEAKDGEITDAMKDVKSVFISEELKINGTYNNDYQDIHGVKVDLSGKSNMELFFNSGPRTAIWFLAVLVAFSILMGGRKNA
ncbi:methyl-accepting chemotaxis protein [Aeromonas jandaei]|uniref:methyl-accepting chemotaxis protein n=1 Tax=Aeromonas jandaei TaxID=650 RepID=UPI001C5AF14F|nr:methyl-accepting chemotaxis protein [Aeromonas jandaei]MBW3761396.1 methyl-accepting chemotaxis protein [Aeromonas jandaei]